MQLGTHEWACSVESIVNLCATSRTTTMGKMRIVVEDEMRNEYYISSALLPAISTLDSCYLFLHLNKWFFLLLVFFQLLSLLLLCFHGSIRQLAVATCSTIAIEHRKKCLYLFLPISWCLKLIASLVVGAACSISFVTCRKKQLLVR